MKVVINRCYGGFGLSHRAILRYWELRGQPIYWEPDEIGADQDPEKCFMVHYGTQPDFMTAEGNPGYWSMRDIARDDLLLIRLVEEMGDAVRTRFSQLEIVEIPDDVEWEIDEYDGREIVAEKHRVWS